MIKISSGKKTKTRKETLLSTILFNLVLESTARRSNIKTEGTILNNAYQCLEYTDDLTLIAKIKFKLKKITKKVKVTAKVFGLEINQ